jgi:hypothetical protein
MEEKTHTHTHKTKRKSQGVEEFRSSRTKTTASSAWCVPAIIFETVALGSEMSSSLGGMPPWPSLSDMVCEGVECTAQG